MSDGALMRIAMDRAELTDEARAALEAQLAKRGLSEAEQRDFASTYRAQLAAEEREQVSKGVRSFQSRRGIGTAFYGRRDLKEMNNREQYQATRWFCIFWIRLIRWGRTSSTVRRRLGWACSTTSAPSARCRWIGSRFSRLGRSPRWWWPRFGSSDRRCWGGGSGGKFTGQSMPSIPEGHQTRM